MLRPAARLHPIATVEKMDELRARVANINEQFRDIKNVPDKANLLPVLIDDAMRLDAELQHIDRSYEL